MAFTGEERRAWLDEKKWRENSPRPAYSPSPAAVCANCQNPFGLTEGVITAEAALCDICLGD